jgi:D-alanine-D-alanine ligase
MPTTRKPHVAVFFGGTSDSHDLSQETGYWVCQYMPRTKYAVTPVHVTAEGNWQVPLGTLPQHGPIDRMLDMLFKGIEAVVPSQGLQRLLRHPIAAFMTTLRGPGGDDGAFHSLGNALRIPVVGSNATTSQQAYHKHLGAAHVDDIVTSPYTLHFRHHQPTLDIVEEIRNELIPPLFIKPAAQEGSVGVELVESLDELAAAVNRAKHSQTDILAQELLRGTEINLSLFEDNRGILQTLPPTIVLPKKATFYDHLSKRRPGRVMLHSTPQADNPVLLQAEAIARDVYQQLGCKSYASFDLIHNDGVIDLLEVNTIPTLTELTPLKQQLQVAGLHPTQMVDGWLSQTLN